MAKQRDNVWFDGKRHWFSVVYAASVSRLSRPEIVRRALAGQYAYQEDKFGRPLWIESAPLLELQIIAQKLEAEKRERLKISTPKPKTAKQQEAAWARMSVQNAKTPRDGSLTAHRIRATIGDIKIKKADE